MKARNILLGLFTLIIIMVLCGLFRCPFQPKTLESQIVHPDKLTDPQAKPLKDDIIYGFEMGVTFGVLEYSKNILETDIDKIILKAKLSFAMYLSDLVDEMGIGTGTILPPLPPPKIQYEVKLYPTHRPRKD